MTNDLYREDDLLASFGKFLSKNDFLILALSGNQQGRFWYQMDKLRKAPDIVAFRKDVVLIGEAKVKSRELFKSTRGRKSDYESLQYLLDNESAKEQIINSIKSAIAHFGLNTETFPPIQAVIVGGDSFSTLEDEMSDSRIWHFTVDKDTGKTCSYYRGEKC